MIPLRPARLFRSRWAALFWAVGVIWTAVTFIGFGGSKQDAKPETALTDATGAAVTNEDLAALRDIIGE